MAQGMDLVMGSERSYGENCQCERKNQDDEIGMNFEVDRDMDQEIDRALDR